MIKLNIFRSNLFKRDLKKIKKRGKDPGKLDEIVTRIQENNLLPKHKCHKLKGNYDGWLECHTEPDWLLIFDITGTEIVLHRTGSHADLF